MYVLQLDSAERDYLLSLLNEQRTSAAAGLVAQLRRSDDVFGVGSRLVPSVLARDDNANSEKRRAK